MKKTILYWSPCLNKIGTVISTINSAIAMSKYCKNDYYIKIVNVFGEWNEHKIFFSDNNIEVIDLNFNYYNFLPKKGYLQSRFSYIVIFLLSFFPMLKIIRRIKPNFLIAHLITSLPLTLLMLFSLNTKFILRISGHPKLNFFRKLFWKKISKKLHLVTCPTKELLEKINELKIFESSKTFFLPDAIISVKDFKIKKNFTFDNSIKTKIENKKIMLAAGRLTRQKNFSYLVNEFYNFIKTNNDYILIILGEGEEKNKLENMIHQKKLSEKIFLVGYVNNVYSYMKNSDAFVLSSLWEEVGFVIVEAAMNNLFVISSDCPNGPKEFLENGKNGLLYENNCPNKLTESFQIFSNTKNLGEKKFKAKINSIKYTKFRHHLILKKILSQ